ncbi:tunicamycin resistance protein [Physocladia obscura]|uniref:UDP-N-acetylglucosamine--dolichyl-phosphate N-acetylglucosaminephosphotransferase n=1 Tax=Physocladia obscura TaxID=109957 RepID=A0AAD5TBY9_9FUNG|nr:tunicamycin resistance protein [Physocladia obscura]
MENVKTVAWFSVPLALGIALMHNALVVSIVVAVVAYYATYRFIPLVGEVFIKHGRFGKDQLKHNTPIIAESMGLIAGCVYLAAMFLFIPVPFVPFFRDLQNPDGRLSGLHFLGLPTFPHDTLGQYLAGLLTLFSMLFLGFVDDVVDIRWRVKIWMPLFACIPLLMVYMVTYNVTHMVVPVPLRGFLYYAYMAALCIFATNAINIIAGMNGVEGVQCLVIGSALLLNSLYQIFTTQYQTTKEAHSISVYFLMPFLGVTIGYLRHNWYPARCFGGDTYVYFAGMTFAVVGILGRFTKTVVLFMFPQVFNFLYSCPQLFGFVECPRHRMPQLNTNTGLIEPTRVNLENTRTIGLTMIRILEFLQLADVKRDTNNKMISCNNLTLINLLLVKFGPTSEENATLRIGATQAG